MTPMRMRLLACVVACAAWPSVAAAQQSVSDILSFLVVTPPAVQTDNPALDRAAAQATRDTLARSLLAALANQPISSSSSGFSYRFNPALGTVERATGGFAPFFVERAATAGAGRGAFAVSFQQARFTQLDGMVIRDGTLVTTSNRFTDEARAFDVETLALDIRATTVTLSASYGVTDRLDIGVALPVVSLRVEGTRTDTYRGSVYQQINASASSTRLGDALGRVKVNVAKGPWGGVSVGGDLRVPTGSEENLVGAGRAGQRVFVIATAGSGAVTAHVNGGLSRGSVSGGFDYGAALSGSPTARLTIVGEVFGHRLSDIGRIVPSTAPHPTIIGVQTLRLVEGDTSTSTFLGSIGMKWNVASGLLLSANVLVPFSDAGLTPRWVPSVALEYNVGR